MNRYHFNYREGDEIAPDRIGIWLPNLAAARDEPFGRGAILSKSPCKTASFRIAQLRSPMPAENEC